MTKSEWSGWVQALGSIAAILGAFYLAKYQFKKGREQALELEKRQLHRRLNAVKGITEDAAKAVRIMVEATGERCSPEAWRRRGHDLQLQMCAQELDLAQTWVQDSHTLLRAIRALRVGVNGAQALYDRLARGALVDAEFLIAMNDSLLQSVTLGLFAVKEAEAELEQDPSKVDTEKEITLPPPAAPPAPPR